MAIKDTLAMQFQMISARAGGGAFGALCSLGEGLELGRWDLEGGRSWLLQWQVKAW